MGERIRINEVIVVEGKYDKINLSNYIDGLIIPVGGFSLFNDSGIRKLLKTMAESRGIIILTDSDSAGFTIRNYIKSFIPAQYIKNAYIPQVDGKEKRKKNSSKDGFLGVEGMPREVVLNALVNAGATSECNAGMNIKGESIRKIDLFTLGLYGRDNSSYNRKRLLSELNLPVHISSNSLPEVLNSLFSRDEFFSFYLNMTSDNEGGE